VYLLGVLGLRFCIGVECGVWSMEVEGWDCVGRKAALSGAMKKQDGTRDWRDMVLTKIVIGATNWRGKCVCNYEVLAAC
jgi:hypothetical protein